MERPKLRPRPRRRGKGKYNDNSRSRDEEEDSCLRPQTELDKSKLVCENELILKTIFEHEDSLKNLANYRLICSNWKRIATRTIQLKNWNARNFLKFEDVSTIQNYIWTISPSPEDALFSCFHFAFGYKYKSDFDWISSDGHYLQKKVKKLFKLQRGKIRAISLNFDYIQTEFLEKVLETQSSSLTELKICTNREEFGRKYGEGAGGGKKNFQLAKLTHLCFQNSCPEYNNNNSPNLAQDNHNLMGVIFNKIPQNSPLKLSLLNWNDFGNNGTTISTLQRNGQVQNLKILSIASLKTGGELKMLSDAGVQLTKLEMMPIYNNTEFKNLDYVKQVFEFLETQANCLEFLSLAIPETYKCKFPGVMPNLKKLVIHYGNSSSTSNLQIIGPAAAGGPARGDEDEDSDDFGSDSEFEVEEEEEEEEAADAELEREQIERQKWLDTCCPIFYEAIFPRLEELKIKNLSSDLCPDELLNLFIEPQFPCSSLRKLVIQNCQSKASTLTRISEVFPHITTLDVETGGEDSCTELKFFDALWTADFAPLLQQLTLGIRVSSHRHRVREEYELDAIFSGISQREIREITQQQNTVVNESKFLSLSQDAADDDDDDEFGHPSILKLRSLKKLIIYTPNSNLWRDQHRGFSNFSVFYLFGKMKQKQLEFLHVDKKMNEFSKEGLNHLKMINKQKIHVPVLSTEERIDEVFFGKTFDIGSSHPRPTELTNLLEDHENCIESESENDTEDDKESEEGCHEYELE